jgi:hypothetical protein
MMTKLFYIGCIFFFLQNNVCGQTAHATIAATITTPVGAEISNYPNFEKFSKIKTAAVNDSSIKPQLNETLPFLKVIGDTFAYDVTIENDMLFSKTKRDIDGYQPPGKFQPSIQITVNFN